MRNILLSASVLALAACGAAETTAPAQSQETTTQEAPATTTAEPTAAPAGETAEAPEMGPAGTYKMDPTHTSLIWKVNHFGLSNYTARLNSVDGTLVFNPDDASATSLDVTIDPTSVETDYPADFKAGHPDSPYDSFDQEISQSEDYFNAGEFPTITFKSTDVTTTGPNTGTVTGDLTFRDVTKPVTLDVTYNGTTTFPWAPDTPKIGFSATGSFKRSDYGLDIMVPNLGDDIEIVIETEFELADAASE